MFKVNNRNTRKRCEICSKLRIKTQPVNKMQPATYGETASKGWRPYPNCHRLREKTVFGVGGFCMEELFCGKLAFWEKFGTIIVFSLKSLEIKIKNNGKYTHTQPYTPPS